MEDKQPYHMEDEDDDTPWAKVIIRDHIQKNHDDLDKMTSFCKIALEKLSLHPSSPEPDFVVDALSDEDFSATKKEMVKELEAIELEDYELSDHLQEIGELEDRDSVYLLGASPPQPPKKFKKFKSYFSKRKDEPEETAEAAEPLEESKGWKMVRKAHKKLGKEYDKFKTNFKKAFSSKHPNEPPGPRMNTPVTTARAQIDQMIREIHLMQFACRCYSDQIRFFESDFEFLQIHQSCKTLETMDSECSLSLRRKMNQLTTFRASYNFMFKTMGDVLSRNEVYVECSKQYEEKQLQLNQPKTSKGFFDTVFGSSKQDKTSKKGKRKSGAKEDEQLLLDPSPKRSKDDVDDDEVIRRLRKTSVTDDDDDDIKDVLL